MSEQLLTMICFHNEISLFEKNTKCSSYKQVSFILNYLVGMKVLTQKLKGYQVMHKKTETNFHIKN